MQYGFHALDKVELGLGVAEGLKVSKGTGDLQFNVTAGMARVGSLNNDGSLNMAQRGMNQPGKVIETPARTDVNLPALPGGVTAATYLVFLKTDGTCVGVIDPLSYEPTPSESDPNDLAPELGNDVFKGEMIDGRVPGGTDQQKLQQGPLRRREAASVLLAKLTITASAISATDNTVRSQILL